MSPRQCRSDIRTTSLRCCVFAGIYRKVCYCKKMKQQQRFLSFVECVRPRAHTCVCVKEQHHVRNGEIPTLEAVYKWRLLQDDWMIRFVIRSSRCKTPKILTTESTGLGILSKAQSGQDLRTFLYFRICRRTMNLVCCHSIYQDLPSKKKKKKKNTITTSQRHLSRSSTTLLRDCVANT